MRMVVCLTAAVCVFSCFSESNENPSSVTLDSTQDHVVMVTSPHEFSGNGTVDVFVEHSSTMHARMLDTSGDAVVRPFEAGFAILNRGPGNNIVFVDASGKVYHQQALPPCNPHDIESVNNGAQALIVCYESTHAWTLDMETFALNTHAVPLTSSNNPPEADQSIALENAYYLTAQNIDTWPPQTQGSLFQINRNTLVVEATYHVPCVNPFNVLERVDNRTLAVGCAGNHQDPSLFQMWFFDIETHVWNKPFSLKGAPTHMTVTPYGFILMEALYNPLQMQINKYTLEEGFVERLFTQEGYTLSGLAYAATTQRLYWGNRSRGTPGLQHIQLPETQSSIQNHTTSFPPFELFWKKQR